MWGKQTALTMTLGIGLGAGAAALPAWAQHADQPPAQEQQKKAPKPKSPTLIITNQLNSKDVAEKRAGMEAMRKLVADEPREAARRLSDWYRAMREAGMHEQIDALAMMVILDQPHDATKVMDMQALRVSALIARQQHEQALVEAKRLYNVATLKGTEAAIDKLALALANTRAADEPRIVRRFKRQQVAGAQPPAVVSAADANPADGTDGTVAGADAGAALASTAASDEDALGENILKSIRVDSAPFESAIAATQVNSTFVNLMARGNLLLLADRPAEAKVAFELACDLAKGNRDLAAATEGVARAIRAEDGVVGRANAYILALRQPAG